MSSECASVESSTEKESAPHGAARAAQERDFEQGDTLDRAGGGCVRQRSRVSNSLLRLLSCRPNPSMVTTDVGLGVHVDMNLGEAEGMAMKRIELLRKCVASLTKRERHSDA